MGAAAGAALLAAVASGSIGPGRLAEVGPAPGAVALAVGLELLVGAAIALFGPVRAGASASGHGRAAGGFDAHGSSDSYADAVASRPAAVLPHWVADDHGASDDHADAGAVASDADTAQLAPADVDPLVTLGSDDDEADGTGSRH